MSDMSGRTNACLGGINHFFFPGVGHRRLEALATLGQPRGYCCFRHAKGGRDLAVAVPVVMAQDQRGRLLGWQFPQRLKQRRLFDERGGIGRRRGASQPPDKLSGLAKAVPAPI